MANRYQSDDQWRRDRLRRGYGRQEEQFQSDRGFNDDPEYGQMGEGWRSSYGEQASGWSDPDYRGDYDRSYQVGTERFGSGGYTPRGERSRFGGGEFAGSTGEFARNRFDRTRGYSASSYGAGSQLAANHGEWRDGYGATPSREFRDYRGTWGGAGGDRYGRGWLDRATDTVASWFSDDDRDEQRRFGDSNYRGRGPANYTRSDERILEDACDALTEAWSVDASQISVTVNNGEVTLDGTVPSRDQKRRAEDCVDDLSGVRNVQNNLRVQESAWDRDSEFAGSHSNPTSSQA